MKKEWQPPIQRVINYCIAAIWLINGLYCKVLNQVPRHQQIVARIAGDEYAAILTPAIGASEILMSVWIISRIRHKLNAMVQILIIAIMNFIEFIYAKDLLLWGSWNSVFALMLILIIYFNEFKLSGNKPEAI
jgi:GGDEF domain-containing protein